MRAEGRGGAAGIAGTAAISGGAGGAGAAGGVRGGSGRRGRAGGARGLRAGAVLGGVALLVPGCASMPDHGEIRQVQASPGADSLVRVFGVPPADKASPMEIVRGFVEAMTADDPQLDTARKYLTEDAARSWKPSSGITVTAGGLRISGQTEKDPETPRFKMSSTMLATVDERSAYQPDPGGGTYEEYLQLLKNKEGQWRIATPPKGLVLSESDFQRIYKPVNKFYFAGGTLVADPVYVRQRTDPDSRMDPMTQTVKSLLDGPSKWLGPVVTSSFPTGTELREGTKSLTYDGQNTLRVPLNLKADNVAQPQCQRMATQLLYTVRDMTASRLDRVELLRSDKSSLCAVTEAAASTIASRPAAPRYQYYVDKDDKLVRMPVEGQAEDQQSRAEPVPGPVNSPALKVGAAAVSHDERRAAVVSEGGHALYVVSLTTAGLMPQPVLTSKANKLTAPSWDARGDLWIADQDPANAGLLWVPAGTGTHEKIDVSGLGGGRISAVRVSADGVRIALLVIKDGRKTLYVGRIERPEHKTDGAAVSVRELRPAAPQMADVTAMSWAPRGRLLVIGRESGGVVQARYTLSDGSMVAGSLPGATGLSAVAATEDETRAAPVVAQAVDDGIVSLPPGAQWRTVGAGGRAPVYPG
ncbi:LpqB family beta-propeller domain-containing protein [Streptomyces sp. NPDC090022]|uniref:LpqB family beta-propeller domain-containing protein n=1 Tax=Streptomyces sp. NPDC090022 TaxID=3365920 RepID=UPI0037F92176